MNTDFISIQSLKKNPIIRGTIILTLASGISRVIGFFFRIFLSQKIGAEGMGIYQLIFPIQMICFSLCTTGYELAISRLVAMHKKDGTALRILKCGLLFSLLSSCIAAAFVYDYHDFLAGRILLEVRCSRLLLWMSISLPLASIHSCISGYYLGMKNAAIPAWTQLVEQCTRVLSIVVIVKLLTERQIPITPEIAVAGSFIGELFSVLLSIFFVSNAEKPQKTDRLSSILQYRKPIFTLAVPVIMNRLMLSVMQSIQSTLIPFCLLKYGYSSKESLGLYGICLGLVLPLILFPSSLIHSVSLMLLPTIAEADGTKDSQVTRISKYSLTFSILFGSFFSIIFFFGGNLMGNILFHNAQCGTYIRILGFLCPFLYTNVTFASIFNGMGKTSVTFLISLASTLIQLFATIVWIPNIGIGGYLLGLLCSNIVTFATYLILYKFITAGQGRSTSSSPE